MDYSNFGGAAKSHNSGSENMLKGQLLKQLLEDTWEKFCMQFATGQRIWSMKEIH